MTRRLLVILGALLLAFSPIAIHVLRAQNAANDIGANAILQPRDFGELSRVAEARVDATPFRSVDIYVDSGDTALAAYQFDFTASDGTDAKLVGIEGGDAAAFKEPPRYDPLALSQDKPRVIVAAFHTGSDLPKGRTRVARLMLRVSPGKQGPQYQAHLAVAASADAKRIDGAKIEIVEGAMP